MIFAQFDCRLLGGLLAFGLGARNTYAKRLTAPDMGGSFISEAVSREYARNTRPVRGILAGRLSAVFLAPGPFFGRWRLVGAYLNYLRALEKRHAKKGYAMSYLGCCTRISANSVFEWFDCRLFGGLLAFGLGARNTNRKRLTAPDMGGSFISKAVSREYARNTRPVRGILAGRLSAVFLAPGPFFGRWRLVGAYLNYLRALEKRYRKRRYAMSYLGCCSRISTNSVFARGFGLLSVVYLAVI